MPGTHSKNLMPEGLIAALRKDAVSLFDLQGEPSVVLKKTIHNPYSQVHVVEVGHAQFCRRIYVKIPHSEYQGPQILKARLVSEFRIMQKLNVLGLDTSEYGVGIPFGYYPDYPAIATLEAGNATLRMRYRTRARLLVPSVARQDVARQVANCGSWLRQFQESTAREPATFDLDELVTYSEVRLKRLLGHSKIGFPAALSEGVIQAIHDQGNRIQPGENRIVGRHNDFAGHNILVSGRKVWVIDFSMFDYGSNAYDPCNFWLELEMLKLDRTYSRRFLSGLQERFLASYGLISPDSPAFQLARCRYTLNRLVTSLANMDGWKPDAFYRRHVVRTCLNWLERFAGGDADLKAEPAIIRTAC